MKSLSISMRSNYFCSNMTVIIITLLFCSIYTFGTAPVKFPDVKIAESAHQFQPMDNHHHQNSYMPEIISPSNEAKLAPGKYILQWRIDDCNTNKLLISVHSSTDQGTKTYRLPANARSIVVNLYENRIYRLTVGAIDSNDGIVYSSSEVRVYIERHSHHREYFTPNITSPDNHSVVQAGQTILCWEIDSRNTNDFIVKITDATTGKIDQYRVDSQSRAWSFPLQEDHSYLLSVGTIDKKDGKVYSWSTVRFRAEREHHHR
jgi:hypothetical protein